MHWKRQNLLEWSVEHLTQAGLEELDALVAAAVEECSANAMADMGKVMQAVLPKVDGRADGGTVSQAVRKALG